MSPVQEQLRVTNNECKSLLSTCERVQKDLEASGRVQVPLLVCPGWRMLGRAMYVFPAFTAHADNPDSAPAS